MSRRNILPLVFAFSSPPPNEIPSGIPTDDGRLNHFANEYNAYVAKLREGVVDIDRWKKTVKAWENLVK